MRVVNQTIASPAAAAVEQEDSGKRFLPLLFLGLLLGLAFTGRMRPNAALFATHVVASVGLLAWYLLLQSRRKIPGHALRTGFHLVASHYVQGAIHLSIFVYWSLYWEAIGHNSLLLVSQILFAYAFDALLSWTRGRTWRLGMAPLPIVFSTNLFLTFRDDWFYLQLLLIAVAFLGKEFLTWERDGRRRHIFNPSAFALFVFSLILILTDNTRLTWAQDIAIRLNDPTHIFLYIFAVGLIVQALFRVTLVTLAAAIALFLANTLYTFWTGTYWFLDAGIPIAVFLGLHLLITDPATSPRTDMGRFAFGFLYGAGVFAIYGILEHFGAPSFYDKLLCVPFLNLSVQQLDRFGAWFTRLRVRLPLPDWNFAPARANLIFMAVWVAAFGLMYSASVVGPNHPGRSASFWRGLCANDGSHACRNLARIYRDDCLAGSADNCLLLAAMYDAIPDKAVERVFAQTMACEQFNVSGCEQLTQSLTPEVVAELEADCTGRGHGTSCYALAASYLKGTGLQPDLGHAFQLFGTSCDAGDLLGCAVLGDLYQYGVGVDKSLEAAARSYKRACSPGYGAACLSLSRLYENPEFGVDASLAEWYRALACASGVGETCDRRVAFLSDR